MSEPESILAQGMNCATCFYSHHWEQERVRRVSKSVRGLLGLMTRREYSEERYTASGIQCVRYPEPLDVVANHGCGEYRLASGIETEGHDRETGHGAKHESPTVEDGDAQ